MDNPIVLLWAEVSFASGNSFGCWLKHIRIRSQHMPCPWSNSRCNS